MRLALLLGLITLLAATATAQTRIIQTNSGGDNIHLIDPATNRIVGEIKGIPVNHGAAVAPDGSRFYFSSEATHTVDVIDAKSLALIKKIPLSNRPHNITITPDGSRVYVAIISQPGAIDVIDTAKLEKIKTIPTKGGMHNIYVTPDGRNVVSGSIAGTHMLVLDAKTEEPAWTLFNEGVRPIAFEKNPDGSTKRAFVQISNYHGFAVVDFAQRKEVARITLPDIAPEKRDPGPFNQAPSHGIGVSPDGRTLWVCSRLNGHVYGYSLPDLKLLGGVEVGKHPDWLTFSRDSKTVYVANGLSGNVSAVDIASRKEVARISVGKGPKRNITAP